MTDLIDQLDLGVTGFLTINGSPKRLFSATTWRAARSIAAFAAATKALPFVLSEAVEDALINSGDGDTDF
jgi:hypothetical protein